MKLRALECFCKIAETGFSFSEAARSLNATQPALTRQIKLLEDELGFPLLLRRGKKAFGLTEGGRIVFERAQAILNETRQLGSLKQRLESDDTGRLVIATTQFHARYTLLPAIIKFRPQYPGVSLSILSRDPATAARLVLVGDADFALCPDVPDKSDQLEITPCFDIPRLIIVPRKHPLIKEKRLTLQKLATYPFIVYDAPLSGGREVMRVFETEGLKPDIALNAMDADVIKAYVAAGIGISVLQAIAYDPRKDHGIVALEPGALFKPTRGYLIMRKGTVMRGFTKKLISLLAPNLQT
jgi:LysR family cys regulon transcriptional activator